MKVTEILFYSENRIEMVVEMEDPDRYDTRYFPHIPKALFKLIPHLAKHHCDNDEGLTFRRECKSTELPHLFEHLVIELQSKVTNSKVSGETQWNWRIDPKGRFHVFVDYENDILALGAIRLAEKIIKAVDENRAGDIDMKLETKRLETLADLGNDMRAAY